MVTVHVRGFVSEDLRDANIDTPGDELSKGTPNNGYVLGERCRTLKRLEAALQSGKQRKVYFYSFILEDSDGNTKATTDEDEAREHLT